MRYPLLSDEGSKAIRAFGVLNEAVPASSGVHGIPHPVTLVVDANGVVRRKYHEEDYRERQTLAGLLAKDYGVIPRAASGEPAAKHIKVVTAASTDLVRGNQRILLSIEIAMPKGFHLYAPGVQGYHAVDWKLTDSPLFRAHPAAFPASRILYLPAIQERVPVYEGKLRLLRDITLGADRTIRPLARDGALIIEGSLHYQACSETICYPPEDVPLKWTLSLEAHDAERSPAGIRHNLGGK